MEFSQTAEYALRAMAWLATRGSTEPASAGHLARATSIPPHYVSKVMRRMVLRGLVVGRKGHGGGFTLARAPHEIRIADVLDAAGYKAQADRCAFGWGRCNPQQPCPLHPVWSQLNVLTSTWAGATTLANCAQLIPPR
jgi:Rrf2 family iron-sulfur cluster assembly transcriptional regulator